jgi:hypothetical protein
MERVVWCCGGGGGLVVVMSSQYGSTATELAAGAPEVVYAGRIYKQ